LNNFLLDNTNQQQQTQKRNPQGLQGRMNEIASTSVVPHIALDDHNNVEG